MTISAAIGGRNRHECAALADSGTAKRPAQGATSPPPQRAPRSQPDQDRWPAPPPGRTRPMTLSRLSLAAVVSLRAVLVYGEATTIADTELTWRELLPS